jgi:hypothetical protein
LYLLGKNLKRKEKKRKKKKQLTNYSACDGSKDKQQRSLKKKMESIKGRKKKKTRNPDHVKDI